MHTNRRLALISAGVAVGVGAAALVLHGQAQDSASSAPSGATPGAPMVVVMNQTPPATRLDTALVARGSTVVRGYTDIGNVQSDDGSGVSVAAVEITDAGHGVREYGLAVAVRHAGRGASVVTNVDADELDALLAALDSLGKLDGTVTPLAGYEGRFKTKADLEVANFADGNGSRLIAVKGMQTLPESGQVVYATAYFPLSRLADVRQLVTAGKQAIDKARGAATH